MKFLNFQRSVKKIRKNSWQVNSVETFSPTSCSESIDYEITSLLRSSLLLENLQEWRLLREMCTGSPYCEEIFLISRLNKPRFASPHRAGAPAPSSPGGFLLNLLQFIETFVVFESPKLDAVFCVVLQVSSLRTLFQLLE